MLALLALLFLERMIRDEGRKSALLAEANKELQEEALERGRAEETLRKREALLETTFETMSQGIAVFDADHRLAAFNRRYVDLWNYPPGFIRLGMPFREIVRFNVERGVFGSGDVEKLVRKFTRAAREGEDNARRTYDTTRRGSFRTAQPTAGRRFLDHLYRHHQHRVLRLGRLTARRR